jgi:hypothetical protein
MFADEAGTSSAPAPWPVPIRPGILACFPVCKRPDRPFFKTEVWSPIRPGILRWPIIAPSYDAVGWFTGELRPPK